MKSAWAAVVVSIALATIAPAAEISPTHVLDPSAGAAGRYSDGTVSVALAVDRDAASLIAFTRKPRPFERAMESPISMPGEQAAIEVALLGPGDARYTQRILLYGVCFDHDAGAPPHIEGDTIRLHRESLVVEVPEIAGFDRLEVTRATTVGGLAGRVIPSVLLLSPDRFTPAGGTERYSDLAFAATSDAGDAARRKPAPSITSPSDRVPAAGPGTRPTDASPASTLLTPGTVHWPEEFGETERYAIWGNEDEATKRINIVIVPDGYTHAEKATMEAHAQALVNAFRARTPYAEHDPFLNYILVYAYSTQSGTDECDCSVVRDTAMNTRFPLLTPSCGSQDNRCLFYGNTNGGPNCDPNVSTTNITAAELRAPAQDKTILMVNTARYGGCGGARAAYSAGNGAATEVAVHELGHSLAGLADEYAYTSGCGGAAGNVNTSANGNIGAWPEWISDLGPPKEGAEYYSNCLYRPQLDCVMRALNLPFCAVCRQQWALRIFGHFRIVQNAPVTTASPGAFQSLQVGQSLTFGALTRFAVGPGVTNSFEWKLQGPGFPVFTTISNGPSLVRSFSPPGTYSLVLEVVADTNFVKPPRYGTNRDTRGWTIEVTPVPEVSDDSIHQLAVRKNGANVDLLFEDVGSTHYNVYVSTSPMTSPFGVASGTGKRDCAVGGVSASVDGMLEVTGYDLQAGIPGSPPTLFVLVTADNGSGTEGSLGRTSDGIERTSDAPCRP